MKNSFVLILLVPFFLISCGKAEEVKTVANQSISQNEVLATGSLIQNNS